jgi:hypothetical protein
MKTKLTAIILAAALTLALAGCAGDPEPAQDPTPENPPQTTIDSQTPAIEITPIEPTDTPKIPKPIDTHHRIGTRGTFHGTFGRLPDLEELIKEADLIVDITITKWLGESIEYRRTFFKSKINNTFKGEELQEIELIQSGYSSNTLENHPLFKVGDRILVFLFEREWKDIYEDIFNKEEWDEVFLNRYDIASYVDVMDIWEYEGEVYLLNRADFTPFAKSIISSEEIEKADIKTRDEIIEQYLEYDPIFEYALYENVHENIFIFDSVTDKIIRIINENNNDQGEN